MNIDFNIGISIACVCLFIVLIVLIVFSGSCDTIEEELGFRPTGLWPSVEAVSPEMVQPVSDVGVQWMVTDEELLKQSTDSNGLFIDADDVTKLATPWIVTGEDGGEAL